MYSKVTTYHKNSGWCLISSFIFYNMLTKKKNLFYIYIFQGPKGGYGGYDSPELKIVLKSYM